MSYTQSVEPSTFLELIKKRGPLTIWEMSVTIETDISRVQEKIEPLIKEEVIVPYEEQGRTYYKIPGGENNHKKNKSIFAPIAGLFNKKLKFESLQDRIAMKEILTLDKNAKVLICSGSGYDEDVEFAFKVGAKDAILKPFIRKEVTDIIKKVMSEK